MIEEKFVRQEDEILHQIIKHYKCFVEDRIDVILRHLNGEDGTTNVYGAKEAAQQLVDGLDKAGEYLIYPERFKVLHNKNCSWCKEDELNETKNGDKRRV